MRKGVSAKLQIFIAIVLVLGLLGGLAIVMRLLFTSLPKANVKTPPVREETLMVATGGEMAERPKVGVLPVYRGAAAESAAERIIESLGVAIPSSLGSTYAVVESTATTVTLIDTARLRELEEKRLEFEIDSIRSFYGSRRKALIERAISFLERSQTIQLAIGMAKAYEDLASKIEADVEKFPEPKTEAQGRLWDAQKEELRKTAKLARDIALIIRQTKGEKRRMRQAAENLRSRLEQ